MENQSKKNSRKLCATYVDGADAINCPPILLAKSKLVIFDWNHSILCYNYENGELVYELQTFDSKIVFFGAFDSKPDNLIVCTTGGDVVTVLADTAIEVSKQNFNKTVLTFELVKNGEKRAEAVVTWPALDGTIETHLVSLSKMASIKKLPFVFQDANYKIRIGYDDDRFFVVAAVNNSLMVLKNVKYSLVRTHLIYEKQICNLICHPKKAELLICDSIGRLSIWTNLFSSKPIKCYYHWHSLPVDALAFSKDGTKFLSAGRECVLVKWDRDDAQTKEFIPRLTAPVQHLTLAANGNHAVLTTADNSVHIIDVQSMRICANICRLAKPSSQPLQQLNFDSKSKSLVLNSFTGHLSFYDPIQNVNLFNLDVTNLNKMTGERRDIEYTEVTCIAFDTFSDWLATVERFDSESKLKFWSYNSTVNNYDLNTVVDSPHDLNRIHYIEFSSSETDESLFCVTLADNDQINVWKLNVDIFGKAQTCWKFHNKLTYRDYAAGGASFAHDSITLASVFQHQLVIWTGDLFRPALIHSISGFEHKQSAINYIQFGKRKEHSSIVLANRHQLLVWSLLTCTNLWSILIDIQYICADPFSTRFAVFTTDNKLRIFSSDSEECQFKVNQVCQDSSTTISSAAFIPNSFHFDQLALNSQYGQKSCIYFLADNKLFKIDNQKSKKQSFNTSLRFAKETFKTPLAETLERNMKCLLRKKPDTKSFQFSDNYSHQRAIEEFVQQPCYTLESLEPFLELYLISSLKIEKAEDTNDENGASSGAAETAVVVENGYHHVNGNTTNGFDTEAMDVDIV